MAQTTVPKLFSHGDWLSWDIRTSGWCWTSLDRDTTRGWCPGSRFLPLRVVGLPDRCRFHCSPRFDDGHSQYNGCFPLGPVGRDFVHVGSVETHDAWHGEKELVSWPPFRSDGCETPYSKMRLHSDRFEVASWRLYGLGALFAILQSYASCLLPGNGRIKVPGGPDSISRRERGPVLPWHGQGACSRISRIAHRDSRDSGGGPQVPGYALLERNAEGEARRSTPTGSSA
jgi:hypothetical protein